MTCADLSISEPKGTGKLYGALLIWTRLFLSVPGTQSYLLKIEFLYLTKSSNAPNFVEVHVEVACKHRHCGEGGAGGYSPPLLVAKRNKKIRFKQKMENICLFKT